MGRSGNLAATVFLLLGWVISSLAFGQDDDKGIVRDRQQTTVPQKSLAILIGVQDYESLSPLRYCRADVRLLNETLQDYCGFTRVVTLTDDPVRDGVRPTLGNLSAQLRLWLKVANTDDYGQVLIYFSGHGFQDEKGRLYLAPPDCDRQNLELTGLPLSYVKLLLDACTRVPVKLLILDCCHAGETKGGGVGSAGDELAREFRSSKGLLTVASCKSDEVSLEWPEKGQGLFTYWLCEGLKGRADRDDDRLVDSGELHRYLFSAVQEQAARMNRQQTVVLRPSEDWQGVALLSRVRHVAARPVLPPPVASRSVVVANAADFAATVHLRYGAAGEKTATLDRGETTHLSLTSPAQFWFWEGEGGRDEEGWREVVGDDLSVVEFVVGRRDSMVIWQPRIYRGDVIHDTAGIKLVRMKAGTFMMGSRESPQQVAAAFDEPESLFQNEHPLHEVQITRPFYMGIHEVTGGQFRRFVENTGYRTDAERDGTGGGGMDPNRGKHYEGRKGRTWQSPGHADYGEHHPVVLVSWNDALAFCQWLSRGEGVRYRLPTEAEWEYACRAGTQTRYWTGDDPAMLLTAANGPDRSYLEASKRFDDRIDYATIPGSDGFPWPAPVGMFRHNPFGLYDMHGNVWEWCQDTYDARAYLSQSRYDPLVGGTSDLRVIRGGCFM